MEPEGSLPHSQVPATCPYPKPATYLQGPVAYFVAQLRSKCNSLRVIS